MKGLSTPSACAFQQVDSILARPVCGFKLQLNTQGKPLTFPMLRTRFEDARLAARHAPAAEGNDLPPLALPI